MFTKLHFWMTEDGKLAKKSRVVTLKDVKAVQFYLLTTTSTGHPFGNACIQVRALYAQKDIEKHPWFEVDYPPHELTSILMPTVNFREDYVEIIGLEDPNMIWAGLITPPYPKQKRVKGVTYTAFREHPKLPQPITLENFHPQRIILTREKR